MDRLSLLPTTMSRRAVAWSRGLALLITVLVVGRLAVATLPNWRKLGGFETYWIAQALVAGEGYSLPAGHAWLFDEVDNDPYYRFTGGPVHTSAWADPVYTFILAGFIKVFGSYHQLAASIFNAVLLLATFLLTYWVCERLGSPPAGVLAVLALASVRGLTQPAYMAMSNMLLSTSVAVGSALCLTWFLEAPGRRRALILGAVLGFTTLAFPGAQLFIPVTAGAVVVLAWRLGKEALLRGICVALGAALVILPWTFRNYLAFDELVPVRTGLGQIAFVGVVAVGGTLEPERVRSVIKPPVTATTPYHAVNQLLRRPFVQIAALEQFQLAYAKEVGGAAYEAMNEAQRDAWFLAETKRFMRENPRLVAILAQKKLVAFMRIMGPIGTAVAVLAVLGSGLAFRKPAVPIIGLWVATYVGPFLIVVPYYTRYRASIEPLLAVLASLAVWTVLHAGWGALSRARRGSPDGASLEAG